MKATRNGSRGLLLRAFASVTIEASVREGSQNPMEGWISSAYGNREPAPALVYTADTRLPVRIVTLLYPADDIQELPDVEVLRDTKGNLSGIRNGDQAVTFDDDEIYVRHRRNH